jgi:hypothetical protein
MWRTVHPEHIRGSHGHHRSGIEAVVSIVDIPVAAGSLATAVFAASTLPMLVKAHRTKDVRSYSLGNIALGNVGNVFYTV